MRTLLQLTGTALCLGAVGVASAQHEARLIQRLEAGYAPYYPGENTAVAEIDGVTYFSMFDTESGVELWRTDSTQTGTRRVCDITPGSESSLLRYVMGGRLVYRKYSSPVAAGGKLWLECLSNLRIVDPADEILESIGDEPIPWRAGPFDLCSEGDSLYLQLSLGDVQGGLWRVDARSRHAVQLSQFDPQVDPITRFYRSPNPAVILNDRRVLFKRHSEDEPLRNQLWGSDGTLDGTRLLISPDHTPDGFMRDVSLAYPVGSWAYFAGFHSERGMQLFRTDGTPEGTRLLRELTSVPTASRTVILGTVGTRLYFLIHAGEGSGATELWKSDGSTESTNRVEPLPTRFSSASRMIGSVGGKIVWYDLAASSRPVLLASDGSEAGTTIIAYLPTNEYTVQVDRIAQTDYALVMGIHTSDHGLEPWITDGTAEGTRLLQDILPGPQSGLSSGHGAVLPDGTILLEGDELWRTDGTATGTKIACDVSGEVRPSSPDIVCVNSGFAVFRAKGQDGGLALWRTKGTQESTSLLRKLYPVNASRWFIPRGRIAEGLAYDASTTVPQESKVLFTDGTYLGTKCLSGPPGSVVYTGVPKRLGDSYYLFGRNGANPTLYRHVNAESALQEVDLPLSYLRTETVIASTRRHRLYFVGNDITGVRNLWESDGTTSGTIPLAKLHVSPEGSLFEFNSRLIFEGRIDDEPSPLWAFNLSDQSVHPIDKDLLSVSELTSYAGGVLFVARRESSGYELWTTDGTGEGTRALHDTEPGYQFSSIGNQTPIGDLCFFVAGTSSLWITDGTMEGTRAVRKKHPGSGFFTISDLVAFHDKLYFSADDGIHGRELWCSDGTEEGTRMVKDVYPGPESGGVSELAVVHGLLYFAGYDHQHGLEVWRSDGTAEGTALFSDVYPGPSSSSPSEFSTAGKFLVFSALSYDGSGFGVWSINLGPPIPPASATSWLLD